MYNCWRFVRRMRFLVWLINHNSMCAASCLVFKTMIYKISPKAKKKGLDPQLAPKQKVLNQHMEVSIQSWSYPLSIFRWDFSWNQASCPRFHGVQVVHRDPTGILMLRLLLLLKHQYLGGITERKMLLVSYQWRPVKPTTMVVYSYQTLSNMFVYKKIPMYICPTQCLYIHVTYGNIRIQLYTNMCIHTIH